MYVMLVSHRWKKDLDSQKCFEEVIKDAGFPKEGPMCVLYIDCEFKEITVDDMGTVNFPKDAKCERWDFDISDYATYIRRWEAAYEKLIGITEDLFYDELWNKLREMEEHENG